MRTATMTIEDLRSSIRRLDRDPTDLMGFEGDVRHILEEHIQGSECGEAEIPPLIFMSLKRYRDRVRVAPGGALRAILENNLGAITRADSETFGAIKTIYRWIHMELPSLSWGSPKKVAAWLSGAKETEE